MDEVEDLLEAWELQELIPTFRSNVITIQALASLSPEEIKELVPQIGPRALFMRCWKTWMLDFTSASAINILDTSNISLSDIELMPIIQSQTIEPTSQQIPKLNNNKDTEVN